MNVPLPPYAGDEPYLRAVEEVVAPAVRRFRPDVLVSMTGVNPHHTDPMAHLQVTTAAFRRLNAAMRDLAFDAAQGRWLVVTGGGYNIDLLARLWAYLLAEMVEVELLPEELPPAWLDLARSVRGVTSPPAVGRLPSSRSTTDTRAGPTRRATSPSMRRTRPPGSTSRPGRRSSSQATTASVSSSSRPVKTWSAPRTVCRKTLGQSPWRARASSSPPSAASHQLVVAGLDDCERHRDPAHAQARLGVRRAGPAREPPGAVGPDLAVERIVTEAPRPPHDEDAVVARRLVVGRQPQVGALDHLLVAGVGAEVAPPPPQRRRQRRRVRPGCTRPPRPPAGAAPGSG